MNTKILSIFVCALLFTSVLAINAKEESDIKQENVSIVFSEPDIKQGVQYITLNIEEANSYINEPGKPILPVYIKIFKFPFGTKIKDVIFTPSQINQKTISGDIQPFPEPVPLEYIKTIDEKNNIEDFLIKDNSVYDSMDFFPKEWHNYRVGCGLDDSNRVVYLRIQFYPVRYSPGQNIIKYTNTVDIKVEYYEPKEQPIVADEYDMVLITPSDFSEKFQPLVDYKNDSGIITNLVTLDEIYEGVYFPVEGRDNQEKIKYFIKNAIEEWNIKYVLLGGGANKVPVRVSYVQDTMEYNFISDLYYADIYDSNGAFCSWDSNDNSLFGEYDYQGRTDYVDLYPDVCLGRLSCRELSEVSSVVNKIITYESTGAYMNNWFSNFVVVGGDTFPDSGNVPEGELLNENAIGIMEDFTPDKIWATNGKLQFAVNIDNAIDNGAGFLYMTGHGTHENWASHPLNDFETWWPVAGYYYYRIELYTNARLPIVIIGGCSNCKFSGENCFGWSFVKNPDGGGIASYGNSALGWGFIGSSCPLGLTGGMELSAFKAFEPLDAKTTGELWNKALTNYINEFGLSYNLHYKTVEEWLSFSDPSMRIKKVSDKPEKPDKPTGPTLGTIGLEYTYETQATDPNGDMVKCCFDWGDNSVGWTDWLTSGDIGTLNHIWDKPGDYSIKVKVRDEYGLDSGWSDPLTVTIVSDAPYLDIIKIKGGIGKVSAVIKNIGLIEALDVNCNISVKGGIFKLINDFKKETFDTIDVQGEKTISSGNIFGLGLIDITVSANALSVNTTTKKAQGFVFGPFVFIQ
ncbi:hypothetical protein AYK24_08655 [Thermoplasmatales archaeon SG8-52-4]|nr:MAG: hypothetical protein AYK24_08655 [Thermoplasmatales archaeon SG8-52-4]